jgi:hypothetical protein
LTLKKGAKDRPESAKNDEGKFAIVAGTRSVRELNGLLKGNRRKPVSIEEMNAAIARGALKGNT